MKIKAFSIIEVLIALVILSLMTLMCFHLLKQQTNFLFSQSEKMNIKTELITLENKIQQHIQKENGKIGSRGLSYELDDGVISLLGTSLLFTASSGD